MINNIELFINGVKVDLREENDIKFTYQRTDYTNPTVIKNSFTKTISLYGTPTNNAIFGSIFDLNRTQDEEGILFNPSQRVDFELFNNGELVENGYVRLDNIERKGYSVVYNITLFGGLSQFFYGMTYDINGNKRTLKDLQYRDTNNSDEEFDFKINKEAINSAWNRLKSGEGDELWDIINFAPSYNGVPEDFDADKCIINTNFGTDDRYTVRYAIDGNNSIETGLFPKEIVASKVNYGSYDGWVNGEMTRDMTEWEMRDLRSYLQRPVLSVKALWDAFSKPINNGGYELVLDEDFFNESNPYYSKAWMTLPMISTEAIKEGSTQKQELNFTWTTSTLSSSSNGVIKKLIPSETIGEPNKIKVQMSFRIKADDCYSSSHSNKLYMSADGGVQMIGGAFAIQLLGYDSSGSVINGSDIYWLTNATDKGKIFASADAKNFKPLYTANVSSKLGNFEYVSNSVYYWKGADGDNSITLEIDNEATDAPSYYGIAIHCYSSANAMDTNVLFNNNKYSNFYTAYEYGNVYYLYRTSLSQKTDWSMANPFDVTTSWAYYDNNSDFILKSDAIITKKTLLSNMEGTPCDYLISFCKIFDIYMEKDLYEKKIYFRTRANWYADKVEDLDNLIDRGQDMDITPLVLQSKWYDFSYPTDNEIEDEEQYQKAYGTTYGTQKVDTQYNFDAEEEVLLEDIVYKNGVMALEKSNYFNNKYDANGVLVPSALYNWVTCTYYKADRSGTAEAKICLPSNTKLEYLGYNEGFWDALSKLQLHSSDDSAVDGQGILCFFNGFKSTLNSNYYLTDDLQVMYELGDNPCWIVTSNIYMSYGGRQEQIALSINEMPHFSRFITKDMYDEVGEYLNSSIKSSWEFGRTKELYIPNYKWATDNATIYELYWKDYIEDLYNVNTRLVECYVKINGNVNDYLKKFFYYDNSLWVCTKITDYDASSSETTKCTFNKVQSKNSYIGTRTQYNDYFDFQVVGSNIVNNEAQLSVYCSKPWTITFSPNYGTLNKVSGEGGQMEYVTFTLQTNPNAYDRDITFTCTNSNGDFKTLVITQKGAEQITFLSVDPSVISLNPYPIGTYNVALRSNKPWHISAPVPLWISISPISGNGSTMLSLTFSNLGDNNYREFEIPFITDNYASRASLMVMQSEIGLVDIVRTDSLNNSISADGGEALYTVNCFAPWRIVVTEGDTYTSFYDEDGELIDFTVPLTETTKNIFLVVDENPSNVSRNIAFYLEYGGFTPQERVAPAYMPLVQGAHNNVSEVGNNAQTVLVNIHPNSNWTAQTYDSWITINTISGTSSNTTLSYTVTANSGGNRKGYIYIINGNGMTEVIEVSQNGTTALSISPSSINIPWSARGERYSISISNPMSDYDVMVSEEWITEVGKYDDKWVFTVSENQSSSPRLATVTFTNGSTLEALTIYQSEYGG